MATRGYRIRSYVSSRAKNGSKEYVNFHITVPNEIAEHLPKDIRFVPRMTDEGLLYAPESQAQIELPAWAQPKENGTE